MEHSATVNSESAAAPAAPAFTVNYTNRSYSEWEPDRHGGRTYHTIIHEYAVTTRDGKTYVFELRRPVKESEQTIHGLSQASRKRYTLYKPTPDPDMMYVEDYIDGQLVEHGPLAVFPIEGREYSEDSIGRHYTRHGKFTFDPIYGTKSTSEYERGQLHGWQIEPLSFNPFNKCERFYINSDFVGCRIRKPDGSISSDNILGSPENLCRIPDYAFPRLIDDGVKLDAKDSMGNTILHWAMSYGYNGTRVRGSPSLKYLLYSRHELVELLSEQPTIDVDARNSLGETPLMLAVNMCDLETIQLLCTRADRAAKDIYGRSALDRVKLALQCKLPYGNPGVDSTDKYNKMIELLTVDDPSAVELP